MTKYKSGQIVWKTKTQRVVFYASFGFNLQKWSDARQTWISFDFSKNETSFPPPQNKEAQETK